MAKAKLPFLLRLDLGEPIPFYPQSPVCTEPKSKRRYLLLCTSLMVGVLTFIENPAKIVHSDGGLAKLMLPKGAKPGDKLIPVRRSHKFKCYWARIAAPTTTTTKR